MTLAPNTPTYLGYQLGRQMARLVDTAIQQDALQDERCDECAFRRDTYPNGCESTLMNALKCAMENEPFLCHKDMKACRGWMVARFHEPMQAPWNFVPTADNDATVIYLPDQSRSGSDGVPGKITASHDD